MSKAYTHSWDDLRLSFLSPLGHLRIDLVAELRLDLTRVPGEQSKETLCPAIDDIDLMKRDCVDNLLALLNLALRALHELGLLQVNAFNVWEDAARKRLLTSAPIAS